ncbi:site-2 protease family protein [Nocardioides sp.]|uniref:site-2 protease family protein n=1 Tax=Nocardioides sp. TaxID=35761 RepID=UPI003512650A
MSTGLARPSARGLRLRVGGLPVTVSWACGPVAVLLALALAPRLRSVDPALAAPAAFLLALLAALVLYATALAHEWGHAWAARRCGLAVDRIGLGAAGGRTEVRGVAARPTDEALVVLAGPAATLGVGVAAAVLAVLAPGAVGAAAEVVAVGALLLGLVDLVPALPLDGGRMLAAALWVLTGDRDQGRRWAVRLGGVVGVVLGVAGLSLLLARDAGDAGSTGRVPAIGAGLLVLGLLLAAVAVAQATAPRWAQQRERAQLARWAAVDLRDVARPVVAVQAGHPVRRPDTAVAAVVVDGARGPVGLLVDGAVAPLERGQLLPETATAHALLTRLRRAVADGTAPDQGRSWAHWVLVDDTGRPTGVVHRADVVRAVKHRGTGTDYRSAGVQHP